MQAHPQYARLNAYHGAKRHLLGNQAGNAPPAWRDAVQGKKTHGAANALDKGSKILLSKLPLDVGENEVEILFAKTVGPVKDAFIVYNSQGKSKGMAIVSFQRASDAVVARAKYNGKIVDGRRPIKIEIIHDDEEASQAPPKPLSLLDRIGKPVTTAPAAPAPTRPVATPKPIPVAQPRKQQPVKVQAPTPRPLVITAKARLRQKKGPKRIKKKAVSAAELDQEMEDYRASADI
ncbi:uncharacterized protein FIBRA_01222 [Fibroporia radiculosa]|uniref:RRM domain-containing protein n=1 Tax=Fibroporia radiculosa TaxID=599839 RepID=J4HSY9_9APHY|nr:uncharacterized protein FIBRA_01222 [Fibroporia radiculosa]CCL99207.1 predicted protein [Fibroporia radiculosa]